MYGLRFQDFRVVGVDGFKGFLVLWATVTVQ